MQLRYVKGSRPVLQDRFPVTWARLRAMVGPEATVYRVEDADTYEWRQATGEERVRIRAWLRRFIRQRGCSPVGTHPVHQIGVVFFLQLSN